METPENLKGRLLSLLPKTHEKPNKLLTLNR